MTTDLITHPTIRGAIEALQAGDEAAWFSFFTDYVEMFDDKSKINFKKFSKKAIGHERFTSVDKVENDGLTIYGNFHSDHWGEFKTYMKFTLTGEKISKIEIGQAAY